jgi:hypothetical protein
MSFFSSVWLAFLLQDAQTDKKSPAKQMNNNFFVDFLVEFWAQRDHSAKVNRPLLCVLTQFATDQVHFVFLLQTAKCCRHLLKTHLNLILKAGVSKQNKDETPAF